MRNEWPFLILRQMPSMTYAPDRMFAILDVMKKYPGCCDEIWFCLAGRDCVESLDAEFEKINAFTRICQEQNILVSYQHGITLGHSVSGHLGAVQNEKSFHFTDDAWMCNPDGTRLPGILCPTSTEAQTYLYEHAKSCFRILKPSSYWVDDDLRLSKAGYGCFCPRCIKRFNDKYGWNSTRETLKESLFQSIGREEPVRRLWMEFNADSLAEYASFLRKAADEVLPECRLGYQVTNASNLYNGIDFYPQLKKLSRDGSVKVGIRPGGGYYSDENPLNMVNKIFDMAKEAERAKKYGFIGQICYEAENYPHITILKSPEAMMVECAAVLAAGCDSLALYFHCAENTEPLENDKDFAEKTLEYRPYFEKIADSSKKTRLAGMARFIGTNDAARPMKNEKDSWMDSGDDANIALICCGIPVTVPEAEPAVWFLTEKSIQEMDKKDYEKVFSSPVVMNCAAFAAMLEKNPSFIKGITLEKAPELTNETFGSCVAQDPAFVIESDRNDLVVMSRIKNSRMLENEKDHGIGSCIFTSPCGGKVLMVQSFSRHPTYYRRKAMLDAVDVLTDGKFPVRLENNHRVFVLPRVDAENKVVNVTLLNMSIGATPELMLTVRNPKTRSPFWIRPHENEIPIETDCSPNGNEMKINLPPLMSWQIGTLFF